MDHLGRAWKPGRDAVQLDLTATGTGADHEGPSGFNLNGLVRRHKGSSRIQGEVVSMPAGPPGDERVSSQGLRTRRELALGMTRITGANRRGDSRYLLEAGYAWPQDFRTCRAACWG